MLESVAHQILKTLIKCAAFLLVTVLIIGFAGRHFGRPIQELIASLQDYEPSPIKKAP